MHSSRFVWIRCGLIVLSLSVGASVAVASAGQSAAGSAAGIAGRVTDESGGVLPGVTVVATSPALQARSVTAITDQQGDYRLTPLPIGTYTTVYELTGFQSVRREEVRLTVGFVARLDVVMKVGALDETITVSGVSPVVDVSATGTSTQLPKEVLELTPGSRNGIAGLLAMAPGVRTLLDVGGNSQNSGPGSRVFGQGGEAWNTLEGVTTTTLTGGGTGANYWDFGPIEEARVQTMSSDAEFPTRGVQLNAVVKSGGNDFHGGGLWALTNHRLQSNNIDDDLAAQGITSGNRLNRRYDYSGDLGGRILRDTLWFYAAGRARGDVSEAIGSFKPDGSIGNIENLGTFQTDKLSYQLSPSHKFVGFFQYHHKHELLGASEFVSWESISETITKVHTVKVEWQGVFGNLVASAQSGAWGSRSHYPDRTPGGLTVGTFDIFTQKRTGERPGARQKMANQRYHQRGSVAWYKPDMLLGNHELKAGFDYTSNWLQHWQWRKEINYQLTFNSGVPFQIAVNAAPTHAWVRTHYLGLYAKDTWNVTRRLTLNLGLRYANDNGFIPAACREAATPPGHIVAPANCFPKQQFPIWNTVAPRLHAAYDLSGSGKTVIKGGWGRFDHMRQLELELLRADPNTFNVTTYGWRDLNGNRDYDPGEVNLDPNGPDFVSRSSTANAVANPNEIEPKSDELSTSFEQELMANLAVRISGIYSRYRNIYRLQNNLRPYETYNVPVTRPDPGADGRVGTADDPGTSFTYYEFPLALAGRNFEQLMIINDPNATQSYKSLEVATFRRLSNGWQFMASYSATKKNVPAHNGLTPGNFNPQVEAGAYNPNAEINQDDRTWEWMGKASGGYLFPAGFLVSGNFEHRSGTPFARQVLFTGGRTIPSITLNVEPIGTRWTPHVNLVNLRVEKRFRFRGSHSLEVRGNIYNVLNTNAVTALTMRAGASFLRPTAIVPPRVLEVSASYVF